MPVLARFIYDDHVDDDDDDGDDDDDDDDDDDVLVDRFKWASMCRPQSPTKAAMAMRSNHGQHEPANFISEELAIGTRPTSITSVVVGRMF